MVKKLLFLILLLICNFSQATEVTWNLTFDQKSKLPLVKLNIQGKDIVLTLDMGSNHALHLPIALIDQIPDKSENPKKVDSIDIAGNLRKIRSFTVNNLVINSFHFNNIDVVEYKKWGLIFSSDNTDESDSTEHLDIPAIGVGLFTNSVLTLNFPEKKIVFSDQIDNTEYLDSTWQEFSFKLSDEGIGVNVSDGIKNYTLILDTGTTASMIKEQSLSPETPTISETNSDYQFVALKIGNVNPVKAIILDSFPTEFKSDGLLGIDFLNKNRVKINFKTKQLWVKSAKNASL